MTAIVGVLNKHAAAIAADSAVTIGNGRKVLNSANKLFTLSKHQPVAIAVYGNAELIGTPWEIIIKEYRKNLGEKSFNSVEEYAKDFLNFIKNQKFYSTEEEIISHIKQTMVNDCYNFIKYYNRNPKNVIDNIIKNRHTYKYISGYSVKTEEYVKNIVATEIDEAKKFFSKYNINIETNELSTFLITILTKNLNFSFTDYSGLVFVGYGNSEIYPSIINYEIKNIVIEDKFAILKDDQAKISKDNSSVICPFAQTDVMQTILDGINPIVQQIYINSFAQSFKSFAGLIGDLILPTNSALGNKIKQIKTNPFVDLFRNLATKAQAKNYTAPFVNSVTTLEKEDLADFAESLITLTSLKRKVSPDQETVGGPIDVMVISKGDGVIWMKRKHYFGADKNHHFFSNYFNHKNL